MGGSVIRESKLIFQVARLSASAWAAKLVTAKKRPLSSCCWSSSNWFKSAVAPLSASSSAQHMIKIYHFRADYAMSFNPTLEDCNSLKLLIMSSSVQIIWIMLFVCCELGGWPIKWLKIISSVHWIAGVQACLTWCASWDVNQLKYNNENTSTIL